MLRRTSLAAVVCAVGALAVACSDVPDPVVVGVESEPTAPPVYDPTLEPAAAVLALVPAEATVLEVTDFEQVRYQLGYGELTSGSDQAVTDRFAREAARRSPLLSPGLLRGSGYSSRFGFSQDDVSWEAHFDGPAGEGYVVRFRDDLDMARVEEAAASPEGPLSGAVVVPSAGVAAVGATREPTASWAADPVLPTLVGEVAAATYVARECVDPAATLAGADEADLEDLRLEPLGAFSVSFGAELVTARLGGARGDVFQRARLAETLPGVADGFTEAYADPVADPGGGRIGFQLGDAPEAARLAQERLLPFAVCAD